MSDQQFARPDDPNPRRNPWVTALLILIGLILLLPGLCSLVLSFAIVADSGSIGSDPGILSLLILCILVGAGGVALIIHAIRRR
jgi:hypothetical protein